MGKDYYAILGVPHDADEDAIKKAYKKQGKLFVSRRDCEQDDSTFEKHTITDLTLAQH